MENLSSNLETKLQPAQEGAHSVLVLYPEHSGCSCITTKELLKVTEINTLPTEVPEKPITAVCQVYELLAVH